MGVAKLYETKLCFDILTPTKLSYTALSTVNVGLKQFDLLMDASLKIKGLRLNEVRKATFFASHGLFPWPHNHSSRSIEFQHQ